LSPKEPEWLDVDFGGFKSRNACLAGCSAPITVSAEVLQTTKPNDTPTDQAVLDGMGSGSRRGKAKGYGNDGSVWVSLPPDYWNFMVAVTIHGCGGGAYGSGGESTFHVMLNPGHFHNVQSVLHGANSIELQIMVEDAVKKDKEFDLNVKLIVAHDAHGAPTLGTPILMKEQTIMFNNAEVCAKPPGNGGCDEEWTAESRCSNKPTEAWGGKFGPLSDNRCGAAPLSNADCAIDDVECLEQFKDDLANSCAACCRAEATDVGRYGERTQGCCQFIWYQDAASLCIWKAGHQEGSYTGAASITAAPPGNTYPAQNRAMLCDCRKKGACKR